MLKHGHPTAVFKPTDRRMVLLWQERAADRGGYRRQGDDRAPTHLHILRRDHNEFRPQLANVSRRYGNMSIFSGDDRLSIARE